MIKTLAQITLIFFSILWQSKIVVAGPSKSSEPMRFIVKFNSNGKAILNGGKNLTELFGVSIHSAKPMAAGLTLLTMDPAIGFSSRSSLLQKIRSNPSIEYAVIDKKSYINPMAPIKVNLDTSPNHALQWDHFKRPGGVMLESGPFLKDGGWLFTEGKAEPPVVVAVIDTGVEPNERLLNNFLYDNDNKVIGWNFAGNNDDISDETGGYHGTHVAGTIAASGTDNLGMGPDIKILPVKIPDESGMFYESAVINGIYWALGHHIPGIKDNPYPVKVMNMSFGIDEGPGKEVEQCDQAVQEAINAANEQGAVMVVAAGNNNMEDDLGSPAGCNGTIRVSSTGKTGLRAYYSNYGRGVTYAAPGGDKHLGTDGGILSTVKPGLGINGSGLDYKQGTSMASPHVAGLFGLVFALGQQQGISAERAKHIVYSTTHEFGDSNNMENACVGKKACGHGIIDADNALAAVVANYRFILNAPTLDELDLTQEGCPEGKYRARAKSIPTKYGTWQRVSQNNACFSKAALDLAHLKRVDFSVIASYGGLTYKIYPQGSCEIIGVDGLGCH